MSTAVPIRGEQLNIRLNPDEMALARRLADHFGLTPAFLIRMLLKEKARELGIGATADAPPPPPSKPRAAKKR